jgi:very-short-patch-repair endonuclease
MARRQYSLINRAQARAAGLTGEVIRYRVETGRFIPVLPGVFLLAGCEMNERAWMMAAYLWAKDGSAISYYSAARIWGLDGFAASKIDISLPDRRKAPSSRLRVHHCDQTLAREIRFMDSIAVTSVPRTLLDVAAFGHPRLEKGLDQCLRDRLAHVEEIWLLLDHPSSFGRRGTRRLRDLLVERSPETAPTQSEMEDLFMRTIRWGRFDEPTSQFAVALSFGTIHIDFAYPEHKLAIECDSYAWHMDRESFERDRIRDAELQGLGWTVLRLTWAQLRWDPQYVIGLLKRYLQPAVLMSR